MFTLLVVTPVFAAEGDLWCKWDGSMTTSCTRERVINQLNVVRINGKYFQIDEAKANAAGYFKTTLVVPAYDAATQVLDPEIETKTDNQIERTWGVRAKTQEELDRENCQMNAFEQWLLRFMVQQGTYTVNDYPAAIVQSFNACEAINP
jgi:hypothetical protein